MILLRLYRYFLGYVIFTASGGFSERFINLCRINNIELLDLKCVDNVLSAKTSVTNYKKLRKTAKKSGMNMQINKKIGLPFFVNEHIERIGIPIGICLCILLLLFFSSRIWTFSVTGNEHISDEAIISAFEECGIRKGSRPSKSQIQIIENSVMSIMPELSWVNVNLIGSMAEIEVREFAGTPEIDEADAPSNIVASSDGQIVYIRPFKGTAEHSQGDVVMKGEVLIGGLTEYADNTVGFFKADGYVTAKTVREKNVFVSSNLNVKQNKEVKKHISFELFGLNIPRKKEGNYFNEKYSLKINGVVLPFGYTVGYRKVTENKKITLDAEELELYAFSRFHEECSEFLRYVEQCENKLDIEINKNGMTVNSAFYCVENIGEEQKMTVNGEDAGS